MSTWSSHANSPEDGSEMLTKNFGNCHTQYWPADICPWQLFLKFMMKKKKGGGWLSAGKGV